MWYIKFYSDFTQILPNYEHARMKNVHVRT
jgi:hypothetical protein